MRCGYATLVSELLICLFPVVFFLIIIQMYKIEKIFNWSREKNTWYDYFGNFADFKVFVFWDGFQLEKYKNDVNF